MLTREKQGRRKKGNTKKNKKQRGWEEKGESSVSRGRIEKDSCRGGRTSKKRGTENNGVVGGKFHRSEGKSWGRLSSHGEKITTRVPGGNLNQGDTHSLKKGPCHRGAQVKTGSKSGHYGITENIENKKEGAPEPQ